MKPQKPPVQMAVIKPGTAATVFACICGKVFTCTDARREMKCGVCGRQTIFLAVVKSAAPEPRIGRLRLVKGEA